MRIEELDDRATHTYIYLWTSCGLWEGRKDKANVSEHGVSFEEAGSAFYDDFAIQFFNPDHSEAEDRFIPLESVTDCESSSSAVVFERVKL